jgi:hypothetical protein
VANAYTQQQMDEFGLNIFGGCYNYRLKRGGTTLSMHSWGAAFDFDPIRNQLRWKKDKAILGDDKCGLFFDLWAEEGFTGLGPRCNFDWMHVQASSV